MAVKKVAVKAVEAPQESPVHNAVAKLQTLQFPDIVSLKQKQEEIVKANPFVEITDPKSYAKAKEHRTALVKARTTLEGEDKIIAAALKQVRDLSKDTILEVIEVSKSAEEKQQEEVKRWEKRVEEEKAERERIEREKAAEITRLISHYGTEVGILSRTAMNEEELAKFDELSTKLHEDMEADKFGDFLFEAQKIMGEVPANRQKIVDRIDQQKQQEETAKKQAEEAERLRQQQEENDRKAKELEERQAKLDAQEKERKDRESAEQKKREEADAARKREEDAKRYEENLRSRAVMLSEIGIVAPTLPKDTDLYSLVESEPASTPKFVHEVETISVNLAAVVSMDDEQFAVRIDALKKEINADTQAKEAERRRQEQKDKEEADRKKLIADVRKKYMGNFSKDKHEVLFKVKDLPFIDSGIPFVAKAVSDFQQEIEDAFDRLHDKLFPNN